MKTIREQQQHRVAEIYMSTVKTSCMDPDQLAIQERICEMSEESSIANDTYTKSNAPWH